MAVVHRPALPSPRLWPLPRWRRPSARGLLSSRLIVVGALLLLVAVALLQVNQFSRLTSTSYTMNELNRQRSAQVAENQAVEAEVARLSSLARVDWEARVKLRMEPARTIFYINVNQPLPAQQTLPTRFRPVEPAAGVAAPAVAGRPWWRRLFPF
ncbi:MAG: hypothetical protein HYX50_00950 [Chloroflexi bacterium]|nr:hypothetical protein [Chloroflexota bacterium]